MTDDHKLPAISFDGDDGYGDQPIKGPILKCVDARWSVRDGTELRDGEPFLCTGTAVGNQRFTDNVSELILKEPGKPLADVDDLNEQVPQDEWEDGLDGKPRPPWQRVFLIYLIRLQDASIFTFISGTSGARIAFNKLTSQVSNMRVLRGANVAPILKLSAKPMKTKFGTKMRPDFEIVEFREIGGGGQSVPQIESPKTGSGGTTEQIGKPVKPVTLKEELNDEIPWLG
jgi:hypothetical protein